MPAAGPVRLAGVLDLSHLEEKRLPAPRMTDVLGFELPLLYRVDAPWLPAALVLWLRNAPNR